MLNTLALCIQTMAYMQSAACADPRSHSVSCHRTKAWRMSVIIEAHQGPQDDKHHQRCSRDLFSQRWSMPEPLQGLPVEEPVDLSGSGSLMAGGLAQAAKSLESRSSRSMPCKLRMGIFSLAQTHSLPEMSYNKANTWSRTSDMHTKPHYAISCMHRG